uniref:Uncharacterized protein n=1 Tax=Rhizophora mucronata TaxID=61149 RepID=A0A2P2JGQ6_RHIMU
MWLPCICFQHTKEKMKVATWLCLNQKKDQKSELR